MTGDASHAEAAPGIGRAPVEQPQWIALTCSGDNAGERAVERRLGVPPYAETRHCVRRTVASRGGRHRLPFDPAATAPSDRMGLIRPLVAAR
jgi:hypothetical protein